MPHLALGGSPSRRVLSERLLTRALSRLSLSLVPTTTSTPPLCAPSPSRPPPAAAAPGWTCASCRLLSSSAAARGSSSAEWKSRQGSDRHVREAKVLNLKSRAAFKLLELDAKHRLFRRNQVVIDLGFAPGSWSQVAVERTKPHGVVVGIDLIPAMPPRGATSIQGDFLSPHVRRLVREVCAEQVRRRRREARERREMERGLAPMLRGEGEGEGEGEADAEGGDGPAAGGEVLQDRPSYIDMEKIASHDIGVAEAETEARTEEARTEEADERMVDVIISDMSEPWFQTSGFSSKTLSRPYNRLMNTSGMPFRDHAGSMDLCYAALSFASDNLKRGGNFVVKFYQGAEDGDLQKRLKLMFAHVHREKPESSRKDSKEAYLVAMGRKAHVTLASIEGR